MEAVTSVKGVGPYEALQVKKSYRWCGLQILGSMVEKAIVEFVTLKIRKCCEAVSAVKAENGVGEGL